MSNLHPAYEIRYREFANEVIVTTYSIDGKRHSGSPRKLKWENLPALLFQLIDAGYINTERRREIAYTSVVFFSPAFVKFRERQEDNNG